MIVLASRSVLKSQQCWDITETCWDCLWTNDGHLETFENEKVNKIICKSNFKQRFEFNLALLRHCWAFWDIFEPNDGHLEKFSYFPKVDIQAYLVEQQ